MFDAEYTLLTRIEDDPLDEVTRLEYEALLRSRSPNCREVRYLELERQLADAAEQPERFASLLDQLERLQRTEFDWDDRGWTYSVPRRFNLWLDSFTSSLSLAVENALRLRYGIKTANKQVHTPLVIARQAPVLECSHIRSGIQDFICRYERRPQEQIELSRDEIRMTIRPAWNSDSE